MSPDLKLAKIFWFVTAMFALIASLGGAIFRDIYNGLFPSEFLPGAFPQDVITILVSLSLFYLIKTTKQNDIKKQIIIIGLLGSLFYLYGIFTIERVYNGLYLIYAAAFASSFWSIIYSLSGFKSKSFAGLKISKVMVRTSAYSSIFIAIIFTFLWIMALIPLMQWHNRIEFLYSIYILDLCFVMPAFFITAVMSLRNNPLGILLAPAIMIVGSFVIFPLGLNELAKPSFGMQINFGPMIVSFLFTDYMLIVAVLHLKKLTVE